MKSLFDFLIKYQTTGIYLILLFFGIWILVSNDQYYNASYINSSNALSGNVQYYSENIDDYFELQRINDQLAKENATLRELLAEKNVERVERKEAKADWYGVLPAKIISKTYRQSENYLTLDIGSEDGIAPGMAVISGLGVVGRIKAASKNFSTVRTILHGSVLTSCEVKRNGALCSAQWEEEDFQYINIKFIPRHISLMKGDTIVTSGYNAVYPPGVIMGVLDSIFLSDDAPFYYARARLQVDFATLDYTYVVSNKYQQELDSLKADLLYE